MKYGMRIFQKKKLSSKFNFHYNIKITTGTVHENQFIVLIISQSVLLRTKNASDISRRENWNTHLCSNFF